MRHSRTISRHINLFALIFALAPGLVFAAGDPPDPPFNEDPPDMAADVSAHPSLCAEVTDPEGDLLDVRFLGRLGIGEPFTVILLPDTQHYSESHPEIFEAQTQWIVDNRAALNIVYVGHLGDIVENGSEGNDLEWDRADAAMSLLEDPLTTGLPEGIPYGLAPGNHDQDWTYRARLGADEGATTRQYNETFGVHRFEGRNYYLQPHRFEESTSYPDNNDNGVYTFSAGGMDFNVYHLEFDYIDCPERHATNTWLDRRLRLHAGARHILISHWILNLDASFSSQGQELYDVIKRYAGPTLSACGHIHGTSRRTDEYFDDVVHTMLSDYQDEPDGGQGWLRILTFFPERDEVTVETYSPWLDEHLTDDSNHFTLPYAMPDAPPFVFLGQVTGVASGGQACVPWSGRRDGARYEWMVEVSDGTSVTSGEHWAFESTGTCSVAADCIDDDPCTEDLCSGMVCAGQHPGDEDDDGLCAAEDNCPAAFNRAQLDSDADGVGDRCDICPDVSDPDQTDEDADRMGDACDPQVADPYDRTPPATHALRWGHSEAEEVALVWDHAAGGDAYSVSRGILSELAESAYGSCLEEGVLENYILEASIPPVGDGYFYLVQSQSFDCGMGTLGFLSDGSTRENLDPMACDGGSHTDAYPTGETTVYGTRSGSHADTNFSDDVYEVLTEELKTGGNEYSRLEHRWSFEVPSGALVEIHVEGHRSDSPDDDSFEFEYSTDGGDNWTELDITNPPRVDTGIDYVAPLPPGTSGTVWIRVLDTNHAANHTDLDTMSVDEIFIRSVS
jgi:hypothetical protein